MFFRKIGVSIVVIIGILSILGSQPMPNPAPKVKLPAFTNVTNPGISFSYLDFVSSTANVDLNGWTNSKVYLRIARSVDKVKTASAIELTNLCTTQGNAKLSCTAAFPNAFSDRNHFFPVGTTVFYQWFIDYRLPEGSDVATIESSLQSYTIVPPKSCVSSNPVDCSANQRCVRDITRAQLTGDTLAPTVCAIPAP